VVGYIYKIENLKNGKSYVGQTVNLKKRLCQHFANAKNKSNTSPLYRSIRKNGRNNFKVSVLEEFICSKKEVSDELNRLEMMHIEKENSLLEGYNLNEGGYGIRGYRHTKETKQKISKRSKELWKNGTFDKRDLTGKNSGLFGKSPSKETRQKMSDAKAGMYFGEDNPNYGKHISAEVKAKMSKSRKGKYTGIANFNTRKVINLTTGKIFEMMKDAGEYYGIKSWNNISSACTGKLKTVGGYSWAYADNK